MSGYSREERREEREQYQTAGAGGMGTGYTGTGEPLGDKIQRKAGEAWEGMKESTPGTQEHRATHPGSGMGSGMGTGMGTGERYTTTGTTGTGYTGTGEGVGEKISRKAGEAWEGVKEAMPGTKEHQATHGTGMGTGMGTGYTGTTGSTEEYRHSERRTNF
jgi:hypothetical protein